MPVVRTVWRTRTIFARTYTEGVLLESSKAETWTPLNGSDLTMKLFGYEFENKGTVQFQLASYDLWEVEDLRGANGRWSTMPP